MVSSVGSGSLTVDVVMAVSVQSRASCSGILVNSDFTSKDTSHNQLLSTITSFTANDMTVNESYNQ